MSKIANPDYPIHDLIAVRWSPYGFSSRPVPEDDLRSLLEAARWAPSSYNEQPWHYFLATQADPEAFEQVLSCLVEANQSWARHAPVLILTVAALNFTRNGKPNAAAIHDIGLASASLCFEATARGIYVHQMIGILPDRAREVFSIPEGYRAITGIAIGYPENPSDLAEPVKTRDTSPRTRKPIQEFVFTGKWGQSSPLLESSSKNEHD